MRLSWLFSLIVILVLGVAIVGCGLWHPRWLSPPACRFALGIAVALLLFLLAVFYYKTVRPIHALSNGIDLLRAQDFSSRLSKVNSIEADEIVDMFNTMMSRLKAERLRLREQNHFFDLVVSVSPMGILILDTDGRITMANPSAVAFFDCTDEVAVVGHRLDQIASTLSVAISKIPQNSVQTLRLSDSMIYRCSRLSFMDSGYAHPFVLIERMTDEVVKAEKKAYEKVVRMIAHEVNNSIAGVNSTLDTASSIIQESGYEQLLDVAQVLRVCQERCVAMSRFITAFADVVKIPEANLKDDCLNSRILACRGFLESICGRYGVTLKLSLCDGWTPVMLDSVLFEQALLNILKNSAESTGEGGVIEIVTTDNPVTLTVIDNGPGISEEARKKLFTPFYSSKPQGQGLGLIFISDVLTKHGCRFSLTTSPVDALTRFFISFPKQK
ncbi:MAG: ATP-binding protein [Muribaculum sp.]|nr:ATP-binding protein [Muribaculum sp.]